MRLRKLKSDCHLLGGGSQDLVTTEKHYSAIGQRDMGRKDCYCGIGNREFGNKAEKAMAPHSSTLAWKIPWTEEPGGL